MEEPDSQAAPSSAVTGLGVATTTTVLAARWPDELLVFDWRVRVAANAPRIHAGQSATDGFDADVTGEAPVTFADDEQVRDRVPDTADRLDVAAVQGWRGYADAVAARLNR